MTLATAFDWHDLELDEPFGISRGTTTVSENVVVRVEDEAGHRGVGGAAPADYYSPSREAITDALPDLLAAVADCDPHNRQRIARRLAAAAGGPTALPGARAAVSIALTDLAAKRVDLPLYRLLGLDPDRPITSSFTVGIDDTDRMAERAARAAETYGILKLKLGTDRDREIVRAVRDRVPDATIRVDANGAWDADEAVTMARFLADQAIEFVEQPVPADDLAGLARVSEDGPLPVAADESCVVPADVPRVAEAADIVVLKLTKSGGVWPVFRMCHAARACGLDVMLGCMTETDASIAAAAHLTPLSDYADLDGALLLAEDAFEGIEMPGGEIDLSRVDRVGTGAQER
ncbi:dipeptide epimerase [Halorientalis regularis]|uniref:L-alanine-DL-glutamate epimerase n=1 Tax=Halorientalis regularis TaxID=660518 RepID=A0A1G7HZ55_9EURY|nr:dipeptide epimerase [Halorientalis regularis]SDF05827.1 L-alanine-DL-glutamate epimerase [Halorientalis regularis]